MSTTRTTATRRYSLPFGDLLGQTLSIYFRNFVPFTVLGAIVLAPWAAIWLPAQGMLDPNAGRIERGDIGKFLLLQIGAFIAQMLLTYLLTGAVTYGVVQQMRGQPAGMGQAVAHGFKNLGRALGTGILFLVRWLLFSLLLVVPGIMEFCRLYVAVPAAVMEGRGGGHAIERSKLLTDGSRWPIFGALVVVGMGTAMISGMVAAVVMIATGGPRNGSAMAVNIVTIALTVVSQGLQATMVAVTYFLLRRGKENADPAALASVFD